MLLARKVEKVMPDEKRGVIDLIEYGVMRQKVDDLMAKVGRVEKQLESLIELANKSKGGLWIGLGVVSIVSSFLSYFAGNVIK